jgi:chromate reductase, NAD(P)H dehydrogenase (quinone)
MAGPDETLISSACAMPANNGIRPNDGERLAGLRKQLADPAQNHPVDGPKWHPTGATSSQHDDLLPQHEDLGFQRRARSEQINDNLKNYSAEIQHPAEDHPVLPLSPTGWNLRQGQPVARAFKKAIADVDAVLFVTPEFNRSIPGGLKNAIDWASRPWGQNSFTRKPSGVIGTSPGSIGTAVAQSHLRGVLCFCNSPLMNNVEAYIQFKPGLLSEDGQVSDDVTADFLLTYLKELRDFVVRVLTVLPRQS